MRMLSLSMSWLRMGIFCFNISNFFWQLFGHTFIAQLRDLKSQRKFSYDQGFSVKSVTARLVLSRLVRKTCTFKIIYQNRTNGPIYRDFLCVVLLNVLVRKRNGFSLA